MLSLKNVYVSTKQHYVICIGIVGLNWTRRNRYNELSYEGPTLLIQHIVWSEQLCVIDLDKEMQISPAIFSITSISQLNSFL